MQKYAVIQVVGKQHKVTEGESIVIDRMPQAEGSTFEVSDVLLVHDGTDAQIGSPLVDKAKVTVKVVNHLLGEKLRVATYKAKSRYRKVRGHRQRQTTLEVVSIHTS